MMIDASPQKPRGPASVRNRRARWTAHAPIDSSSANATDDKNPSRNSSTVNVPSDLLQPLQVSVAIGPLILVRSDPMLAVICHRLRAGPGHADNPLPELRLPAYRTGEHGRCAREVRGL
jgi:hypothetical protein